MRKAILVLVVAWCAVLAGCAKMPLKDEPAQEATGELH
jgi:uncharacterized protein YceK